MRVGVKVETERLLLILEAAAGNNKLTRRLVNTKKCRASIFHHKRLSNLLIEENFLSHLDFKPIFVIFSNI